MNVEEEAVFDSEPYPEIPEERDVFVIITCYLQYSDELMDAAQDAKSKAVTAAESGVGLSALCNEQDYANAVNLLTESLRNQYSNLTLIRRAEYLLKENPPRPNACIHDCDYALSRNPDSAKGLKTRGKAYA